MMTGPSRSLGFRHGSVSNPRPFSRPGCLIIDHSTVTGSRKITARLTAKMADSDFVVLESNDNYTFVVPRKLALASGTLRAMLDEDGELQNHLGARRSPLGHGVV